MKRPFTALTREDVERLRRCAPVVPAGCAAVPYRCTAAQLEGAARHLETLYQGRVTKPFAAKIYLLNELYEEAGAKK